MRSRFTLFTIAVALLFFANGAIADQASRATKSNQTAVSETDQPMAVFRDKEHEFAPLFEGVQIKHDFVVENKGKAPLVIKNVRPD